MGRNNKAKRAAKAKDRARRAAQSAAGNPAGDQRGSGSRGSAAGSARDGGAFRSWGAGGFAGAPDGQGPLIQAAELWSAIVHTADGASRSRGIARFAAFPADVADRVVEETLGRLVGTMWEHGWQPAELVRQIRRVTSARLSRLIEVAIHADHEARSGQRIDPRWSAQLRALGQRDVSTRAGWLRNWRAREQLSHLDCYRDALEVLDETMRFPPLDLLIPNPGAPESAVRIGSPKSAATAHPMLERVRKLLAKAEATEFEDEATTFTAKAQELMTRYAIDSAELEHEPAAGIRMVRMPVDAPYADAKATLLTCVAGANRSRVVGYKELGLYNVIGHADDLAAVELLFTSLLVQAQNSLAQAGRGGPGRRTRSATFRASFYVGFARRISERLTAANDDAASGVVGGALVLRGREEAVKDTVDELYGDKLVTSSVRGAYDYAGHQAGRQAADAAKLGAGEIGGGGGRG